MKEIPYDFMRYLFLFSLFIIFLFSCQKKKEEFPVAKPLKIIPFAKKSNLENTYSNFNSPVAINKIVEIENEYFKDIQLGNKNKYYGTVWREGAELNFNLGSINEYAIYENEIKSQGNKPDSLHCTLYAYEALKAGMNKNDFNKLEKEHKRIWKDREIAGWSVGYLLIKEFNWKAYLILDTNSEEFKHCRNHFRKSHSYPVWKQPDIYLEEMYLLGKHDSSIQELLEQNEFGWGFSKQGFHTWITRFDVLKECNWAGVPYADYSDFPRHEKLFLKTPFLNYRDYLSHVIIFPPKQSYEVVD